MESSPMRYVVACALGIVWLTTAGAAEIYCNAQGRDCRDRPSGNATIARTVTAAQAASITSGNDTTTTSSAGADPVATQRQQNASRDEAQAAVQKDLADKRSEQCKKAQENYQRAITASTISTTDKTGAEHVMTDAEANQYRLNARLAIEQSCKSGG
jgi:hypothetical protein